MNEECKILFVKCENRGTGVTLHKFTNTVEFELTARTIISEAITSIIANSQNRKAKLDIKMELRFNRIIIFMSRLDTTFRHYVFQNYIH